MRRGEGRLDAGRVVDPADRDLAALAVVAHQGDAAPACGRPAPPSPWRASRRPAATARRRSRAPRRCRPCPSCGRVRLNSALRSAASKPVGAEHAGRRRHQHARMPSSSASAQPCSGPAPPNGTSVKSRGSWPRSTETTRSAPTMLLSTMARMPRAASSRPRPSGRRRWLSIARAAASASSAMRPPSRHAGRWPSTTWASVTVGSVPPRP